MSSAAFVISAFGDEIADDLQEQLRLLQELRVGHLEFRSAWGKNVLHMTDEEVTSVRRICDQYNVTVSCIGSPIGKSPIDDPVEIEMTNLSRIFQVADLLGTRRIRIFSFYPPGDSSPDQFDAYVETAVSRLAKLSQLAEQEGFELLLENEKGIVGDTPGRCHAIVSGVENPHLRFLWDPANFVQVGVARPMATGWSLLSDYVTYVHIKDALLADGTVCAAGEGDGEVQELLEVLCENNYRGILALEPHLVVAGHSGGFSGVEGMRYAVEKLREVLTAVGGVEISV